MGTTITERDGCHGLIIDDFPDSAGLLKLILTRFRHDDVRIALSGEEGLVAAERDPPDLIIIRIMMSDLDGYEVCRRLMGSAALRNIPVLLQAAMDPGRVYPEAKRVGAAGYLLQPYHYQDAIAARDMLLKGETYYPPSSG